MVTTTPSRLGDCLFFTHQAPRTVPHARQKQHGRRSGSACAALDTRPYLGRQSDVHHDPLSLQERYLVATADSQHAQLGSPPGSSNLQAILLLNLGALLFASNQIMIKTAGAGPHALSATDLSAVRFAIAALCFAPQAIKGLRKMTLSRPAMELGLWLFGGYTTQALGLAQTTAAHGAFTGTFTVLAVPALVGLSGRRVAPTTWAAAAVALAGVGLLTAGEGSFNNGDALCILSALLFGVHKWRSESITAAHAEDTSELVALQLAVLGGISVAVALPPHLHHLTHHSLGELIQQAKQMPWLACVYMGLVSTAATLAIEMHALKTVSAPVAALIYTSEPVWGALGAWALLGERWGNTGWAGAGLIIAASLSAQIPWGKRAAKEE